MKPTRRAFDGIAECDVFKLPMPKIPKRPKTAAESIITQIRQAHESREQAQTLLRLAKQAVETPIEKGEAAALDQLDDCLDQLPERLGIPVSGA